MRWSAAQALGWIINYAPFETVQWTKEMGAGLAQAEIDLGKAIGQGKVTAYGRPDPHGLTAAIPSDPFRIPGTAVVVDAFGDMAPRPAHKKYEGPRWQRIEFDPAEIKRAWPQRSPRPAVQAEIRDWMLREAENNFLAGNKRPRKEMVATCMDRKKCSKLVAEAAYADVPEEHRFKRGRPKHE